jgi:hypothetical protein
MFAEWVQEIPLVGNDKNQIGPYLFIEAVLLGLGLALRAIRLSLFTEPDQFPEDAPHYVHNPTLKAWDALTDAANYLAAAVKE